MKSLILLTALAAVCGSRAHTVVRSGNYRCYYAAPADGSRQPYHVYVPVSYRPDRPAPVALSLHGFGGRTSPPGRDWRRLWADHEGWLLVSLDGRGRQNWDYVGEDDVFAVLDDLERQSQFHDELYVDRQRVYVEGCSMGGHGCYRLAFRYPDRITAAAPAAGWTTYREFYAHWYDAASGPRLPAYVDPAWLPQLRTASAVNQVANGRDTPLFITYDLGDTVNPPLNAESVISALAAAGGTQWAERIGNDGHCRSYDGQENFAFFRGKRLDDRPRQGFTYITPSLRYTRCRWVELEAFILQHDQAEIAVSVAPQAMRIQTRNVRQLRLSPPPGLFAPELPLAIHIDDHEPVVMMPVSEVRLAAQFDPFNRLVGWRRLRQASPITAKTSALCGPLAEAFRSPFVIIYGTAAGQRQATSANPDWTAARRFASDWNAWMTLQWGGRSHPGASPGPWWQPPYPFASGQHVAEPADLVGVYPDTDFRLATVPQNCNLILYGTPASNWLIAHLAPSLPLHLQSDTLDEVTVTVAERSYRGEHINYWFVAPRPDQPERYVVVARGYLSSAVEPAEHGLAAAGKDLEQLPFWPDYTIWDRRIQPRASVQPPLRYLPEAFLEAGHFDGTWQLDTTPPALHVAVRGKKLAPGAYRSPVELVVTARDCPGGFGTGAITYRLANGPWRDYLAPIRLAGTGRMAVELRASDRNGQVLYGGASGSRRGFPAPGNVRERQIVLQLSE